MNKTMPKSSAEMLEMMQKALLRGSSYERLHVMLEFAPWCRSEDWLRELGREWSGFDNVGLLADELIDAIATANYSGKLPIKEMMEPEEIEAFENLPDVVTVYRGCYEVNKWGLCWTLKRDIAEQFPFMLRYAGEGRPLLIKAEVKKSDIVAIKLDRKEAEVITLKRPKCLSISTAREKPATNLEG